MIYITGDCHGQFNHIIDFCVRHNISEEDIIILLGDVGLNYYLGEKDKINKQRLNELKPTFICVHGNHEERPENIDSYMITTNEYGRFYFEQEFPDILFCIDGYCYNIHGKEYLALGGAYSVDKHYRLARGWSWFESEQMDNNIKENIKAEFFRKKVDYVIAHTCPYKYIPREMFLSQVDQSTVDSSMELFLDDCEENIGYSRWYCGHYHCNKSIDKVRFLFNDIVEAN